jgi:AcrR family transcriptional regulator
MPTSNDPQPSPSPPWQRPKHSRREARPAMDQQAIVAVALEILDADGLEAVTMRRVAQELGTGPASLYAHVNNKSDLLDMIHDAAIGDLAAVELSGEDWREQLKDFCRAALAQMAKHRDIAVISLVRLAPTGPNVVRVIERMLGILRSGGLSDPVIAYGVDTLALYISATAFEQGIDMDRRLSGTGTIEERFDQLNGYYESLPPEQFPHVTSMSRSLLDSTGDRLEFGLDVIIAGIEAMQVRHDARPDQ